MNILNKLLYLTVTLISNSMLQLRMFNEDVSSYRFGFNGMMSDDDIKDIVFFLPIFNS